MTLADGNPAETWDTWTRVITSEAYWKKDGTLHNKAFSGKAFAVPEANRPWSHELSGRLLSLIANLPQESGEFCARISKQFSGIMFQKVEKLRSIGSGFQTDVVYTPYLEDTAHGDFASFGTKDEDLPELRDWLQDVIQCVRPDLISAIEALRQSQLT
jgi:hypothetical protein